MRRLVGHVEAELEARTDAERWDAGADRSYESGTQRGCVERFDEEFYVRNAGDD